MAIVKKQNGKKAEGIALNPNPGKLRSVEKPLRFPSRTQAADSRGANQDAFSSEVSKREKIALLAYTYWVQRGCQGGSPEEDWLRAEWEITSTPSI